MSEAVTLIKKIRQSFETYAGRALWIKTKGAKHSRLLFNSSQRYLDQKINEQIAQTGKVRILVLKGRQQGISTYTEGRFYYQVTGGFGRKAFILTHEDKATKNLFAMASRYHKKMAPALRPSTKRDSTTEMYFDKLDSGYGVGTARTKGTGRSDMIQYFHGCLAEGSLVITVDGRCKPIEDWRCGDLVVTHTGKAAPISYISSQTKEVYELSLFGTNLPVKSSADHKFLTRDGWKKLSDIAKDDVLGYPVREIKKTVNWIQFKSAAIGRYQGGGSVENVPAEIPVNYSLGRVFGLYLAEGTLKVQYESRSPCAVCFTVHENEVERTKAWLGEIEQLLSSVTVHYRKNSKACNVMANGKSFANLVSGILGRTNKKQLPSGWWDYGTEFVRGLCHGYLAGDGHSSKREYDRRISAPSIREAITFGMRDALASLGYGWAVVNYKEAAIRHGRNEKAQWTLRISGDGVDRLCAELGWYMPPRKRKSQQLSVIEDGFVWLPVQRIDALGKQKVYDFEVDHEDHSYCLPQCATHNSEVAFWPNQDEHVAGVLQALPNAPGTEAILETTANGKELFYDLWQEAERGQNEWWPIFIPWFWQEEYRKTDYPPDFELTNDERDLMEQFDLDLAQIAWRRNKINSEFRGKDWIFRQEYPSFPAEAFQASQDTGLIEDRHVIAARKATDVQPYGPRILGLDVARQGKDRSAMAFRQGRLVHWLKTYDDNDLMATAGWAARIYDEIQPDAMFIDETGGYGAAVVDRMRERGYNVIGIQFGGTAIENLRYKNKRTEMWGNMNDWLREGGVSIPDEDDLHSDLTGPQEKRDSNDRMILESKEDMKKFRGIESPDKGDALALTFAQPVTAAVTKKLDEVINRPAPNWRVS